jgi:hypothetical protein
VGSFFQQHLMVLVGLQQPEQALLHPKTFTPQTAASLHLQVCFSLQLESVVLLDYLGPTPQQTAAAAATQLGQQQSVGFNRYGQHLCWQLKLHQYALQGYKHP